MTEKTLESDIRGALAKLLEMARELCSNRISNNCRFLISEIKNTGLTFPQEALKRRDEYPKRTLMNFDEMIVGLKDLYPNLHDVNLHVFRANKSETIVDVRYYPRTALETEYREKTVGQSPMLHCKIAKPPYSDNGNKFDIHWEIDGGLLHRWRMRKWRRRAGIKT